MCGCNKKTRLTGACKKYVSRLTAVKVKLLVASQNTTDPELLSKYQDIIGEIDTITKQGTCPKLSVITALETFVTNELN